jgi:hypothetical protein
VALCDGSARGGGLRNQLEAGRCSLDRVPHGGASAS